VHKIDKRLRVNSMEEIVKDILMRVIADGEDKEYSTDFFSENIDWMEFDSLKTVEFMMQIEEAFGIYIDEASMAKLDFNQTYQILVDGVVDIVKKAVEN
jgi:acyl carrier protein